MKSDREQENLLGPVHTVQTRLEKLPATVHRPATSAHTYPNLVIYDKRGRIVERVTYTGDEAVSSRTLHIYDEDGLRVETLHYDAENSVTGRSTYTYRLAEGVAEELHLNAESQVTQRVVRKSDREGHQLELAIYLADGRLMTRMVTVHDEHGREKETLICHGHQQPPIIRTEQDENGNLHAYDEGNVELSPLKECGAEAYFAGKLVYEYDESGNLRGYTMYAPDGTPADRLEFVDDKKTHRSEVRHYNAAGELQSREVTEREVDEYGNHVREVISSWVQGKSQADVPEPTEIHYREITYYAAV